MRAHLPTWTTSLVAALVLLLIFVAAWYCRTAPPRSRPGGRAHHRSGGGVRRHPDRDLVMDDNHPSYGVGDRVTVIHDRDDHDRFRTEEFSNEPSWAVVLLALPLLGGLFLLFRGVVGFAGRRRGGSTG